MARDNYEATTLGNIAPRICDLLKVKGCVVLTLNENDSIGFTAHAVNRHKANELLSVGIHINLGEHDEAIRRGDAGPELQRAFGGGGR